MLLKAPMPWFAQMSGESSSLNVFAISLCSTLLTQRNCEPGPLAELGLQELSALLSLIHSYGSIEHLS